MMEGDDTLGGGYEVRIVDDEAARSRRRKLAIAGGGALLLLLIGSKGFGFSKSRRVSKRAARPCEFKLTSTGLWLDAEPVRTVEEAIAKCRARNATAARITATGDSLYGTLVLIKDALGRQGIRVLP